MADPAREGAVPAQEAEKKAERPKGALSTQIINPVTIAALLVLAVVCAYFEKTALAFFLGFTRVFFLYTWLWRRAAVKRVERYSCLYSFTLLKWKQTLRFSDEWTAKHRGIHPIPAARIRSGDGFGMVVSSKTFAFEQPRRMVVYPALVPVAEEKILQEMWDSRSRSSGYLEDVTLLRSVRGYRRGDDAQRINQRMLARDQGLQVNQYQVVTPDSVLFLFDAASFAGAPEALEAALSILASLLVALRRRGVAVGLALGKSAHFPTRLESPTGHKQELWPMLELLAAAGAGDGPIEAAHALPVPELIGRTHYIAHSVENATALPALAPFPPHRASCSPGRGAWRPQAACPRGSCGISGKGAGDEGLPSRGRAPLFGPDFYLLPVLVPDPLYGGRHDDLQLSRPAPVRARRTRPQLAAVEKARPDLGIRACERGAHRRG